MTSDGWTAGRARRAAFYAVATTLSLLLEITMVGVTALTIGMWLANENRMTTPVGDLSFFALGGIIIGPGLVVQLRAPERHVAGLQQAIIGLLALALAGLIGSRVEPLTAPLLLLPMVAILAALHPARREVGLFPGAVAS